MRCFYHGDVEAVALCKSCGHAICHDCCADVDKSAACRNRCEEDVAAVNDIITRNKTVYQKTSGVYGRSGIFFVVFGALFAGVGGFAFQHDGANTLMLAMGALLVVYGITQFFTARRFKAK